MPNEASIVRTELDTLLPQVPAASHSPMTARLGEAAPAAAVSRNNSTPSPPPKREGGPAALPTYPPTPLRPVPAASGNELRVLTVEQSTSLDSARSLRLDDIKSGDARHLEWMTKFIAAQWRMIPLDILAPPVARRMIPDDTGDVADTKSAASDTQQQPQQQQQQQQQQPIDVSTAASQNSARDVQRVTAWHSLRLSWRRRLAEPLINKDDDALAVWRKAVFAGMMTSTVLLSVIKLLAAFIAHFAAPINGIQEGGYFLLIGCILLVNVSLYIYARHTQELTEWATYAVLVLLMAEQHVWLSLNGQHYASVAVLAHSLLLLTWLFAVVSPVVKFCGVSTAFVFSLVGFIQSELIHRHGPEEFLMHSPNGTVASNSFLGVLVVCLSFQSNKSDTC
ncbi:transmembrane protein, putative [Bodo saltans]|uniref:Transmembrane protein, putative n=1 Tax=Bodo saltans TaxID=75058 RepID=A0A0S4JJC5_BODSA|nr:transmembrane protein, putative [Bodo saltans]|eukprot:CUG91573.1 transmembrane protein, putative [Bodo saltans]